MPVRLRLPELLDEHDMSVYALARQAAGRLNESALYRLVRENQKGQGVRRFDAALLEVLCDTLGVGIADVLEYTPPEPDKGKRRPARKMTRRSTRGRTD